MQNYERAYELLSRVPVTERSKPEMRLALGRAALASGHHAEAFKALGLNVDALKLTDPINAMEQMARALQDIGTRAEQLDIFHRTVAKFFAGTVA